MKLNHQKITYISFFIVTVFLTSLTFGQELETSYDVSGAKITLPPNIVATWKSGKITVEDWKSYLDKIPWTNKGNPLNPEDISWKHTLIQQYIANNLIYKEAQKSKLEKTQEFKDNYENTETRLILDLLHHKEVMDKIIPSEKEMEEYYNVHMESFASPETFSIRHIFVDASPIRDNVDDINKAHIKIEESYKKLQEGESFENVAKEYSESDLDRRGQVNGPFKRGQILKEIEEAALSLKTGEYSSIITTKHGFNIVFLEEHKLAYLHPFDEVKQSVKSVMQREKQPIKEQEIIDLALKASNVKKRYELIEDTTSSDKDIVLIMDGYSLTIGELNKTLKSSGSNMTFEQTKQFLDTLARNKALVFYAKKLGYKNEPNLLNDLDTFKKEYLTNKWLDLEIKKKLKISNEDLLEYFDRNSSRFYTQKEINASNIYIKADASIGDSPVSKTDAMTLALDTIKWILAEIRNGAKFDEMARNYSNIPNAKNGGEIGWVHMGPMGRRFDMAAFKIEAGQITDPIEMSDGFQIIKVHEIRESHQMSFEEAQDKIKEFVEQEKYNQIRSDIIREILMKEKLKYDLSRL